MITVNINIASVFAQYENANELKEIAQSVVNQVNEAYKARLAELKPKTAAKQPTVEITTASTSTNGKRVAKKDAAKAKQAATKDTKTKQTKAEPKAKKERKPEVPQVKITSLTKAQIKKLGIHFEKYNEKCMLVVGETQSIKDAIKDGGWARWYSRKDDDRQGWMVNNDYAKTIAKELKIKLA